MTRRSRATTRLARIVRVTAEQAWVKTRCLGKVLSVFDGAVRLVERIKRHGALASIMGPSNLPTLKPEMPIMAKAMDLDDIRPLRDTHRAAVRRAKRAGYRIACVQASRDASILWLFLSRA